MSHLNLQTANAIGNRALAVGREIKAAPLTVAVLDAGGHLISL
ncbi:heme-binding protein, partial [Pseudomonas toyotomiensis]